MDSGWKPRAGSGWKSLLAPTGVLWTLPDDEKEPLHVMTLGSLMCISRSTGVWSHRVPSLEDVGRVEADFGVSHWSGMETRPAPSPAKGEVLFLEPHREGKAALTPRIFEEHESGPCPVCGLHLVSRVEGDREVIIHELPHCDRFRQFTEEWMAKPRTMREPVQVAGVKQ